jgi:hypothetical protein
VVSVGTIAILGDKLFFVRCLNSCETLDDLRDYDPHLLVDTRSDLPRRLLSWSDPDIRERQKFPSSHSNARSSRPWAGLASTL